MIFSSLSLWMHCDGDWISRVPLRIRASRPDSNTSPHPPERPLAAGSPGGFLMTFPQQTIRSVHFRGPASASKTRSCTPSSAPRRGLIDDDEIDFHGGGHVDVLRGYQGGDWIEEMSQRTKRATRSGPLWFKSSTDWTPTYVPEPPMSMIAPKRNLPSTARTLDFVIL